MKTEIFKNKSLITLAVFFSILIAGIEVLVSFLIKDIIDASTSLEMNRLGMALIYLLVIIIFDVIFNFSKSYSLYKFEYNVTTKIRSKTAEHIIQLPYKDYRKNSTSYYTNILTKDIDMLETDYLDSLVKSIYNVFQIIFGTAAVLTLSWKMALGILVTMLIPLIIPSITGPILSRARSKYSNESEKHLSMIKQLLEGFDLIKANQIEKNIVNQYDKANDARGRNRFRYFYLFDLFNSITQDTSFLTMSMLFGLGAYLIIKGELSVGALIAVVNLLNSITQPLNILSQRLSEIKSSKDIMKKIEGIITIDKKAKTVQAQLKDFSDNISISNLSYQHEDRRILDGITLSIKARKKYAIVGLSGAGKSTLIKLIAGIYPDYQGEISYDGNNITDLDIESVIKLITYIHQDTFLFDDTLENNLTLYNTYSKEEITAAIQKTKLNKVIEGTNSELREVGEFGISISGGERQRIAVARGILRKTPIYILDEITASLDPQTEEEIFNMMLSMNEITMIAVTHNWNQEFLEKFDHVIVLSNGKLKKILDSSELNNLEKYL